MLFSHIKTQNKIPKHLGHSPKQSMHIGNAQASETMNEKHITANLASTGSQIIITMFMELKLHTQE
jgi:hypothetical protein